jgi:hypothetical protein
MGSSKFYFYLHKYVYFIVIVQNRLGCLTPFKHRLNDLNAKRKGWPTVYRLTFRKTLVVEDLQRIMEVFLFVGKKLFCWIDVV